MHPNLMGVPAQVVAQNASRNPYYRKAIESAGGENYTRACQVLAAASKMRLSLQPAVQPPSPVNADELDGWLTDAVAATTAAWERAAQFESLNNLIAECERNIGGIATHTEPLCRSLADDLDDIMHDVSDVVDQLNGARTPAQVIDLGVIDAWKKLPALRAEYDSIRTAQQQVMARDIEWQHAKSDRYYDDPLATDTALANLDDLFPHWKDGASNTYLVHGEPPDPRPWPKDPVEQLVWLSSSDARPWVPTLADLAQLNTARRKRLNPQPDKQKPPASLMTEARR